MSSFSRNGPGHNNAKQSRYGYNVDQTYSASSAVLSNSMAPVTSSVAKVQRLHPTVIGGSRTNGLTIQGTQEYDLNLAVNGGGKTPKDTDPSLNEDPENYYDTEARPRFPVVFNTRGVPTISQAITIKNIADGTSFDGEVEMLQRLNVKGLATFDEDVFMDQDLVVEGEIYGTIYHSTLQQRVFTPTLINDVGAPIPVVLDTAVGIIHGTGDTQIIQVSMTWSAQATTYVDENVTMAVGGIPPTAVAESWMSIFDLQGMSNPNVSGNIVGYLEDGYTELIKLFATSSSSFDAAVRLTAHDFGYQNGTGNFVAGHMEIYAPITMEPIPRP